MSEANTVQMVKAAWGGMILSLSAMLRRTWDPTE